MNSLDFLRRSPQLFIFNKEANKTNFGGVLFLIYIIACLTVLLYYILDYTENNKFEVEYTFNYNLTNAKDVPNMLINDDLNQRIEGFVELINNTNEYLSENFVLMDKSGLCRKHFILFNERASEIDFKVYYKCSEKNCSLRDEDLSPFYTINFCYNPFIIAHQNKYSPIYKEEDLYSCQDFQFSFDVKIKKNLEWQVIKYKDKGGLFSEGKENTAGSIKSGDIFIYDRPNYSVIRFNNSFDAYVLLYEIQLNNIFNY